MLLVELVLGGGLCRLRIETMDCFCVGQLGLLAIRLG